MAKSPKWKSDFGEFAEIFLRDAAEYLYGGGSLSASSLEFLRDWEDYSSPSSDPDPQLSLTRGIAGHLRPLVLLYGRAEATGTGLVVVPRPMSPKSIVGVASAVVSGRHPFMGTPRN